MNEPRTWFCPKCHEWLAQRAEHLEAFHGVCSVCELPLHDGQCSRCDCVACEP